MDALSSALMREKETRDIHWIGEGDREKGLQATTAIEQPVVSGKVATALSGLT